MAHDGSQIWTSWQMKLGKKGGIMFWPKLIPHSHQLNMFN